LSFQFPPSVVIASHAIGEAIQLNLVRQVAPQGIIIFDEAHLQLKDILFYHSKVKEIILLSASPIDTEHKNRSYTFNINDNQVLANDNLWTIYKDYIDIFTYTGNAQQIQAAKDNTLLAEVQSRGLSLSDWYGMPYRIEFFPFKVSTEGHSKCHNIGGQYATMHHRYFESKGMEKDLQILSKRYKKIVVLTSHNMDDLNKLVKNLTIPDLNLIFFKNTSTTLLKRFREKDCIVFCTYKTAAEGINFSEAQCMVCYDFGSNSIEKSKQSLGRVKRMNNKEEDIDIYFATTKDTVAYVLTKLNVFYAIGKTGYFSKKKREAIEYIIQELGIETIKKLSMQEMLLLFSCGNHEFKDFKTSLPLDLFMTLTYKC